jgi:lysophospholipase L1-like esterase
MHSSSSSNADERASGAPPSSLLPPRDVRSRLKAVLIGDSITQMSFDPDEKGWGAALQNMYSRNYDIYNRGFSGYNSRWIKHILPSLFPDNLTSSNATDFVFATVFLGANDSVHPGEPQHVPLEEYRDNILSIVTYLKSINPAMVVILITPPCVDKVRWPSRDPDVVYAYSEAVLSVGQSFNIETADHRDYDITGSRGGDVKILDLWPTRSRRIYPGRNEEFFVRCPNPKCADPTSEFFDDDFGGLSPSAIYIDDLVDGLHLNAKGNAKVFEGLQNILLQTHLRPDGSTRHPQNPMQFPPWKELIGEEEDSKKKLSGWKWENNHYYCFD